MRWRQCSTSLSRRIASSVGTSSIRRELLGDLPAVDNRHAEVQQDDVERRRGQAPTQLDAATNDILATLNRLQKIAGGKEGTLHLARGVKVFHKNMLYITKPLGLRFWTRTAALNDADDIAGSLLMRSIKEDA
jgi:hypothetical protein